MKKLLLLFATLAAFTVVAYSQDIQSTRGKWKYAIPENKGDGWLTTSISEVGIDSERIAQALSGIQNNTYEGIHGLVIIKDGFLVLDEYFTGYQFKYDADRFRGARLDFDANTIHNLASVTKSVTGLLVGIAFDEGYLNDVNDRVIDFFPDRQLAPDAMKDKITLHHLLSMTSGLQWNEQDVFYSEVENDIIQLFIVPDPVGYILSKPIIHDPGTNWYYNGGGTNLMGEIIHMKSGSGIEAFAEAYLFSPLQIVDYEWVYINPQIVYTSGNLQMRPRDLAKLGYLVLNDGVWNNEQVVSKEWIEKMTDTHWSFSENTGYGYQWWLKTYQLGSFSIESYYASGWGGQSIQVFPSLNTVVVFTAGNYDQKDPSNEIIQRYLLLALIPEFREKSVINDEIEFNQVQKEAPLTTDVNLVLPEDELSDNIKALSGLWYGRWDYNNASQFVVENIGKEKAEIVYCYMDRGAIRKEASVNQSGKISFEIGSATLTFEMEEGEDVLIGCYRDGNNVSKIVMKRRSISEL